MSAEQAEFFNDKGEVSFDTWSTDQLRDEVKSLFKNYPDTSFATRQELIEILKGERPIFDLTRERPVKTEALKELTPEEVVAEYRSVFGRAPAYSLDLEGQKTALDNIDQHRYELAEEDRTEKNVEKRKFHHV